MRALLGALAACAACTAPVANEQMPPPMKTSESALTTSSPQIELAMPPGNGAAMIPGFVHSAWRSRFSAGALVRREQSSQGDRFVSTDGVYIAFANGFSVGRPNAHSPTKSVRPLFARGDAHDARVLSYFKESGLPHDQIAGVQANAMMEAVGRVGSDAVTTKHIGYISVVTRAVEGVPVMESRAWAQFNANDDVVAESVWWPPIPAAVLSEVDAARQMLAVPSRRAVFESKLPEYLRGTSAVVAIHHSPPMARGGWHCVATIDFSAGVRGLRSFDREGNFLDFSTGTIAHAANK